ncbi:hypothetical protein UA08_00461 [Talaromyces atroroseus]|uniref:Uncharacterized protein n=1 Tax=Talaromyces atroroseus TaxID=1441469 RepID=A0A225AU98_TALAT|nr:hypothetical protein UA08_00461 [Talaromyces atroroseus]OKL64510.1 hypothetical protein UA08_00461 [Talaromyces atroroseus]
MASTAQKIDSDYRVAKSLPFELRQHCAIYFEEKLYSQALSLLLNLLTCGTTIHAPALVPAPQHLALAATILVHPSTTTQAKSKEEADAAGAALQLLRLTLELVGPISAKFDIAFTFKHFSSSRHGGQWRSEETTTSGFGFDDDETPLNLDVARSKSLWSRAEDFWHIVGWAFNCSVLYPRRWERWQTWLDFMCLAMEVDWMQRESAINADREGDLETVMKESLVWKFISTSHAGNGRDRRMLRAIFADGSGTSLTEFREVFKNELKELNQEDKTPSAKRRTEVNIDEDEYGDYLSEGEDDSDAPDKYTRTRAKRARVGTRASDPTVAETEAETKDLTDGDKLREEIAASGGFQSLALRQRLLALLSRVSNAMPKTFMNLDALYILYVENIRHLPLPVFQAFVSPTILPWFQPHAQSTLCEALLWRMRETSGPDSSDDYLNQKKLQECYLPYAASTASAVDNAKLSILLESLIVLLANNDLLRNTPILREAVITGNTRRIVKAEAEIRRNKASRELEDEEWTWLVESADRLLYLVQELLPMEGLSNDE